MTRKPPITMAEFGARRRSNPMRPKWMRCLNLVMGFLFAFVCAPGAFAEDPAGIESDNGALTMEGAFSRALATNPTIIAERYRQAATNAGVARAAAGALPQLNATGSLSQQRNDQTVNSILFDDTASEERTFKLAPTSFSVSAEQPIFDGLRTINAVKQANAQKAAGAAALRAIEQDVLLRTAIAYVGTLRDDTLVEIQQDSVAIHIERLKHTKARFEGGEVSKTDISQASARLAAARAQLASALTARTSSHEELRALIGDFPRSRILPMRPELPPTLADAKSIVLQSSPDLGQRRALARASQRQVKIAASAFSPTLSAFATYRIADEPSPFTVRDQELAYGLRANVPLFLGGSRLAQAREARALAARDRAQVMTAEREALSRVASLWQFVAETDIRVMAAKEQIASSEDALNGVKIEHAQGLRTTLDVLNAEQERIVALANAARADFDQLTAAFRLKAELGALAVN